MKNIRPLLTSISCLLFFCLCSTACKNNSIDSLPDIEGKWNLLHIIIGDTVISPCPPEAGNAQDPTILFTKNESGHSFQGQAIINSYFGSLIINAYLEPTHNWQIIMGNIGSTEIGGPPALMQCEHTYYSILEKSNQLAFDQSGYLILGTFAQDESSEDQLLVFKKD